MKMQVIDLRTKPGKTEFEEYKNSLARAWKENAITAIYRHSEFRFTADGRRFSMVIGGGETIGYLLNANGYTDFQKIPDVKKELRALHGAIVVCDERGQDGEFFGYSDISELIDAWRELRSISGVSISEADAERLAEYDEGEDDDE
jgi:hypothetical protein